MKRLPVFGALACATISVVLASGCSSSSVRTAQDDAELSSAVSALVPSDTTSTAATAATSATSAAAPRATKPSLTIAQQNAVRSAKSYLSFDGFSRLGLIDQLSSKAGDGYAKHDAVVAVDSLKVDWNAEAAESAKSYLSFEGFSCSGLIDQLSSSAGDKYTVQQARYGAKKAGVC